MFSFAATFVLAAFAFGCTSSAVAQTGDEASNGKSRIAFIQSNAHTPDGDVYTMTPTGADERQLTNLGPNNNASWEQWSPGGRQIVFSEFPKSDNFNGQLWVMNADGSHQHLLLREAGYDEEAPSFSPDGAFVAFTRCKVVSDGEGCAIYRIRTNGTELTAITHFQKEVSDWEPVYSPDGSTIAFESFSRGGLLVAIYLMNSDGSDIRLLTPAAITAVNPQWSRDGEKIVFRNNFFTPQNNDIWVIRRDGSDLTRLTGSTRTDYKLRSYVDRGPSFSPDGQAVVFDSRNLSTNALGIFVISADGRSSAQLLRRPAAPPRKLPHPAAGPRSGMRMTARQLAREIEYNASWPRWSPELH
jgi:Tol biopolymer transport system component